MNKQEFLAFSLPYELKTIRRITNDELPIYSIIGLLYGSINFCIVKEEGNQDHILPINIIMPILHPLSDCFKEIEHNGEKFVPLHRLLENNNFDLDKMSEEHIMSFGETFMSPDLITLSDLPLYLEWHFDLADLISKGEAIDVNTLEINPYK